MTLLRSAFLPATALLALLSAPAAAERVGDKYWLNGQALFSSLDTSLRIDNSVNGNQGTLIDLEKDLGASRHLTVPTVLIGGRISSKWRLEFEYLGLPQSATRTIDRTITIDDTTYNVGATLQSRFKTDIYRFVVGWSPIKTDTAELGFSIGGHITNFDLSVSGQGATGGGTVTLQTRSKSQLAPLPTIGTYANYDLSEMFSLYGRIDFFALTIDKYSGHLVDAQAGVQARFAKNFGIGAGYRFVDYRVGIKNGDWRGRVEYKFHGPLVFAELAF